MALAHQFLQHIDYLKGLIELDFDYILTVSRLALGKKPDHILLEFYAIHISDVYSIFPLHRRVIDPLVITFTFFKHPTGEHVMVLDLLTVMCILCTGPLVEKARLLFSWYNVSKTGLMDEFEHTNFITRTCRCLCKMKLLGSIDISFHDAKYLAMDARVRFENNKIRFLPGLYFYDFAKWIQTNKVCAAVFRYPVVLNRLVEGLTSLQLRATGLLGIMEAKKNYKPRIIPVPTIESLGCLEHDLPLYVTYRSHDTVAVCLSYLDINVSEVYIRSEKLVALEHKPYEVPKPIVRRHVGAMRKTMDPRLRCCDKFFLLESYQKYLLPQREQELNLAGTHQQVCVSGLDDDSRYYLTFYTNHGQYRRIEVRTMPRTSRIHVMGATEATASSAAVKTDPGAQICASAVSSVDIKRSDSTDGESGGKGLLEMANKSEDEGVEGSHAVTGGEAVQRQKQPKRKRQSNSSKKHHNQPEKNSCPSQEKERTFFSTITILPSSLTVRQAEKFVKSIAPAASQAASSHHGGGNASHSDQIDESGQTRSKRHKRESESAGGVEDAASGMDMTIFTGTICPINPVSIFDCDCNFGGDDNHNDDSDDGDSDKYMS